MLGLLESKRIKSARITLKTGEAVGQYLSSGKEEVIVVIKGTATLVYEKEKIKCSAGGTHFIKENVQHNVINECEEELQYIYVVTPL